MLRSRKKNSANSLDDGSGKFKGSRHLENKHSPLIPTPILIGTVLFFIFLGFASEHYKQSRTFDPFAARSASIVRDSSSNNHSDGHSSSKNSQPTGHVPTNARRGKSLLSEEEDAALEFHNGERYHVIFSTDCSPYQHWQSFLVYYTAMNVKQPGHVTRIASGCEPDEAVAIQAWFDENVQYMSKRFHLHLTPHFSGVKDENGNVIGDYKFFNKPFGLKYFLEHFELLGFNNGNFDHADDIIMLIDPDMALLRPITSDFSNDKETIIGKRRQGIKRIAQKVQKGFPFAQTYGLGTQWQKFDLEKIAGPNTPAKKVSKDDGALYFPAGPPYIGTVHDMYLISQKWTEFVPKVHAQYPYLLAEMYAYCIAAAHLGLRHQIVDSLMISNTNTGGEGWPLIDAIPPSEMCEFARHPDSSKYPLPTLVHLCQRYCVGEDWFFGKRRINHDIYECETSLFEEPPSNLATAYDFRRPPNQKDPVSLTPKVANQEAFMVCYLTTLINDAATFYKTNACAEGAGNFAKSRKIADLFDERKKK